MVVNGYKLLNLAPIDDMLSYKVYHEGVSHGMSEAGYDIRIKQGILFAPDIGVAVDCHVQNRRGRFTIASTVERFKMPSNLMGIVHDKSSWARRGLSVFNTVIEPGWEGFLTLELVYHGEGTLEIRAGSGIAQVVFHEVTDAVIYAGRYQNQADEPVHAIRAQEALT